MQQHIDNLVKMRILKLGQKAKNNPETIDLPSISLGVANKDYPAMTPHFWNSVYKALNMETRNIRLFGDPSDINQILETFKADPRYLGGDIGVGFKDKAWQLLDEIDPLAKEMRAINVIVKLPDSRLKGYNTDGIGYAISLANELKKQNKELSGQKVIILGAGGTSNAIAFALADQGVNLTILNRTVAKAENLAQRLNQYFGSEVARFGGRDQVSSEVSTSSAIVSVIDDPSMPLDKYSALGNIKFPESAENIASNIEETKRILESLPKNVIISDVMLRNEDTATIKLAKEVGLPTLDGMPMVFNQAIEAFWLVNKAALKTKGVTKEQISQIMSEAAEL